MKNIFIYTVSVLFVGLGFFACDSTTSPRDLTQEAPSISELELSPKSVEFTKEEDGSSSDTTINVQIQVQAENLSEDDILQYVFSLKNSEENLLEGQLETTDSSPYTHSANVEIETSTTSIEDYVVNVLVNNEPGQGNYAQSLFKVRGFPNDPPQILEVNNPEEVQIPSGNEVVNLLFTAKVTDPDGQDNIDRVLIEFVNKDGSRLVPNPNELLDDGRSDPNESGDQVAGDSVYTIGFSINSSNTPNERTVQYFAIDKAGLSSDTVETQFNIVE